jgi:hypothetical protein
MSIPDYVLNEIKCCLHEDQHIILNYELHLKHFTGDLLELLIHPLHVLPPHLSRTGSKIMC